MAKSMKEKRSNKQGIARIQHSKYSIHHNLKMAPASKLINPVMLAICRY